MASLAGCTLHAKLMQLGPVWFDVSLLPYLAKENITHTSDICSVYQNLAGQVT